MVLGFIPNSDCFLALMHLRKRHNACVTDSPQTGLPGRLNARNEESVRIPGIDDQTRVKNNGDQKAPEVAFYVAGIQAIRPIPVVALRLPPANSCDPYGMSLLEQRNNQQLPSRLTARAFRYSTSSSTIG
jgi:hypothetical protein